MLRKLAISGVVALAAVGVLSVALAQEPAPSGTVRITSKAVAIGVGVTWGDGTLTFQGKTYPFEISGAGVGATLTLSVNELEGRALNLRTPGDLAGNYIAVSAGGALVGGVGVARLRNANGVVLVVRGPRLGAGISINLARVTITMM